jgi:hypothetical protein
MQDSSGITAFSFGSVEIIKLGFIILLIGLLAILIARIVRRKRD